MPRSLDPTARLTLVLASDLNKPVETQPRIFARTLTIRQQRELMQQWSRMKEASSGDAIDAALDAAMLCLVGWENMVDPATGAAIEFNRDNVADVLSLQELVEVIEYVSGNPTAAEKKKSE